MATPGTAPLSMATFGRFSRAAFPYDTLAIRDGRRRAEAFGLTVARRDRPLTA